MSVTDKLFFGVALDAGKTVVFDLTQKRDYRLRKLVIEATVVTSANYEESTLRIQLTSDQKTTFTAYLNRTISGTHFEFFDAVVTLSLTKGNGPIHVYGYTIPLDDENASVEAGNASDNNHIGF